ncbi:MAG: ATP synthase subunit I [Actinomycetota bacterium]|nr:ATP synthase subunit I [Actinomycetota bacterium]
MDRLAALFEQLPLPEITRLLRRTVLAGIGVGVVALGLSALLGHALVGLGACVGLALGLVNIRLVTASVARVNERAVANPKRVLASQTLARLGITTVVVIGLLLASIQVGFGAAGGIAVFYFLLIASLVRSILKQGAAGLSA